MNKKVTFLGMDPLAAIESHIDKQLVKIEHFLEHERTPIDIEVTVSKHPDHAHNAVTINIFTATYRIVFAQREGPDFYPLIDEVVDIAYRDLCKQKERLVDKHKDGKHRGVF